MTAPDRNTLLTYPRTGTSWTQRRMRRWAKEYMRVKGLKEIPKTWHTHALYHPKYHEYVGEHEFKVGKVFALIRNARKVVVSNWYWLQKRGKNEQFQHPDYKSLETYVPYGAPRYVHYLNWLMELELEAFYFSEDISTEEFSRTELPRMLGVEPFDLDELGAHRVKETTNEVVNLVGADHSSVPPHLITHIDEVVERDCRFQPYLDRYCG